MKPKWFLGFRLAMIRRGAVHERELVLYLWEGPWLALITGETVCERLSVMANGFEGSW